jgi:DNA polymerase iota
LAIQQKQIIVTCNYEARRRGLHKLQLIREAKKVCPDVVIVLGEDLTRFRDASKDLYNFLRGSIWSGKAERLGFDEVWYVLHEQAGFTAGRTGEGYTSEFSW